MKTPAQEAEQIVHKATNQVRVLIDQKITNRVDATSLKVGGIGEIYSIDFRYVKLYK